MRALLQPRYGDASVLVLSEIDPPAVGPDDVRVRVVASALNFADKMTLLGIPVLFRPMAYGLLRPSNPVAGLAAAGVVEETGSNVTQFEPGDAVVGAPGGGCAEVVVAPASGFALKPDAVSFDDAATVPIAATTALQGLRDAAALRPGQRVLVNGASGGVGTFAVQIAKALGADVTAVCSAANAEQARSLGADEVIDYASSDYTTGPARIDVLFDLVGNHPFAARRRVLKPDGVYVASFGQGGGKWLGPLDRILAVAVRSLFDGRRIKVLSETPNPSDLSEVLRMIESGEVVPVIERTWDLADAAEAFGHLLEGHARGKLVIRCTEPDSRGPTPAAGEE